MNRQRLKRYVAILAAGLWALLLSVCQVQAQDKKDAPTTPPGKDAPMQDKKEAPTTPPAKDPQSKDKKDAQAQDKKDDVAKSVRKEKIRIARAHSHDHDHEHHEDESGFMHFVSKNSLTIQIVSGVVVAAAVAFFIYLRRAKGNKNVPPPADPKPMP